MWSKIKSSISLKIFSRFLFFWSLKLHYTPKIFKRKIHFIAIYLLPHLTDNFTKVGNFLLLYLHQSRDINKLYKPMVKFVAKHQSAGRPKNQNKVKQQCHNKDLLLKYFWLISSCLKLDQYFWMTILKPYNVFLSKLHLWKSLKKCTCLKKIGHCTFSLHILPKLKVALVWV